MILNAQHGLYVVIALPFVLLTAPLLVELFVLTCAAMLPLPRSQRPGDAPLGRLVVIIPGHNEDLHIARCVHSLIASAACAEDILVIAHNCTDRTADLARAAGALVSELNDLTLTGKGNALSHGFRLAFEELGADAVLIVDADSIVAPNLIALVRQRLQSSQVLQCRYESLSDPANPNSRLRALAFFCMNVVRPMGRKRLHLSSGIFGNGFAIRREVLERVPYNAHSIVEDLEFHLALISAGITCDFLEEARIWADVPSSSGGATTQSARWEGGRIRMLRAYSASLFVQVLRGRIRLLEPLFDLLGLPLAIEFLGLCFLLILPVSSVRIYALCGFSVLLLHLLFAVCSGPDPSADLRALALVPAYLISKLRMLPAIVQAARNRAAWVRTARTDVPK